MRMILSLLLYLFAIEPVKGSSPFLPDMDSKLVEDSGHYRREIRSSNAKRSWSFLALPSATLFTNPTGTPVLTASSKKMGFVADFNSYLDNYYFSKAYLRITPVFTFSFGAKYVDYDKTTVLSKTQRTHDIDLPANIGVGVKFNFFDYLSLYSRYGFGVYSVLRSINLDGDKSDNYYGGFGYNYTFSLMVSTRFLGAMRTVMDKWKVADILLNASYLYHKYSNFKYGKVEDSDSFAVSGKELAFGITVTY